MGLVELLELARPLGRRNERGSVAMPHAEDVPLSRELHNYTMVSDCT
jgi:hypothetical protein